MQREKYFSLFLTTILVVFSSGFLSAQSVQELGPSVPTPTDGSLPIQAVTLYINGVAYFQREGFVEDSGELEFSFKASEVNDLLKSLTLRDLEGGTIKGVSYGSQDPVEKRLAGYAVNLSGEPELVEILSQLRGERLRLLLPEPLEGVLVGVESRFIQDGESVHRLTILSDEGLRSFPLDEITSISFLNPRIEEEFRLALAVLGESRNADKKTIRVAYEGTGIRRINMGYLSEAPMWKTSYRLVLGQDEHYLQGWAIIENATDQDWNNVRLSLVSGRPSSFIMDLSSPRYVSRPSFIPPTVANSGPVVYEDVLGQDAPAMPAPAPRASMKLAESQWMRDYDAQSDVSSWDETAAQEGYASTNELYEKAEPDSYGAGVTGSGILEGEGNLVRYRIATLVSVPRRESAMFPLVDGKVTGSKVSVFDPAVNAKRPLLGVELHNDTPYTLLAGPLTIFEEGNYAGDAYVDDLLPDTDRLITFAVDMETEVALEESGGTETVTALKISKGLLTSTRSLHREATYRVKNSSDTNRELIILRSLDPRWTLIEPLAGFELARDARRFRLSVSAKDTKVLQLKEERQLSQTLSLLSLSDTQLLIYSSTNTVSRKVKEAFALLIEKRSELQNVNAQRMELERKIKQIKEEQARIRNNMNSISQSSELYKRYLGILSEQEDELAGLLEQSDDFYAQEKRLKEVLDTYILGLDLE